MAVDARENAEHSEYGLGAIWRDVDKVSYLSRVGVAQQTLTESFRTVLASPVTALFSLVSISAALFLLAFFLLAFQNSSRLLQDSSTDFSVSVYLKDAIRPGSQSALFDALVGAEAVREVQFWDKEKALREFETAFRDFEGISDGLAADNPLPASFEVTLVPGISYERYVALADSFRSMEGVADVRYEHELVEQLAGLVGFMKKSGAAAALVVLIITGFVIACTIRLALFYRQDELAVMRLVGATSWFIHVPCVIEGALYGLVGGGVGLLFLLLFFWALQRSMLHVAVLAPVAGSIEYLSPGRALLVLGVGLGVGVLASFFAARKVANE